MQPRRTFVTGTALFALVSCAIQDHRAQSPTDSHEPATTQQAPTIFSATLSEPDVATRNISTEEMEAAVRSRDVVVLDTRPRLEWAISHIPGALNVAPKPGTSIALYVSDIA